MHINMLISQEPPDRECNCPDLGYLALMKLTAWYGSWMEGFLGNLPFLRKVTIDVSCGNMTCVMALQSSRDEIRLDTPNFSRAALLIPVYNHDPQAVFLDYTNDDTAPPCSAEFFEHREVIAVWTRAHGWQADAKVTGECRQREASFMTELEAL